MADVFHWVGGDLSLGATGDLNAVESPDNGRQRLVRRYVSNPAADGVSGDVLFHPTYGAGLPRRIGTTNTAATIGAVVRSQTFAENTVVAQEPPPVIDVAPIFGGMSIRVSYQDLETGRPAGLGFNVER